MIKGLEEKRVSYIMKDKSRAPEVSELLSAPEKYAHQLKQMMAEMKTKSSTMTHMEIELKNNKEEKASEQMNTARKKILSAHTQLMNAVNTLI